MILAAVNFACLSSNFIILLKANNKIRLQSKLLVRLCFQFKNSERTWEILSRKLTFTRPVAIAVAVAVAVPTASSGSPVAAAVAATTTAAHLMSHRRKKYSQKTSSFNILSFCLLASTSTTLSILSLHMKSALFTNLSKKFFFNPLQKVFRKKTSFQL